MQRKILQTVAAYVAASLAIWGALDLAINAFTSPAGLLRAAMIASIIGFPFAIAIVAAKPSCIDHLIEKRGNHEQ